MTAPVSEQLRDRALGRLRQDSAPLREAREQYLESLLAKGTSALRVRDVGSLLIHVVNLLDLSTLRAVSDAELAIAERGRLQHIATSQKKGIRASTAETFRGVAESWLRFHGLRPFSRCIPKLHRSFHPFTEHLREFVDFFTSKGVTPEGVYSTESCLFRFFVSAGRHHQNVGDISMGSIDDFFAELRNRGLKPRSISFYAAALRAFFRYGASRGWCSLAIARGIKSPPVSTFGISPAGPSWKDVRRLLAMGPTDRTATALRANAILFLCATYGLRGIEVRRLQTGDFDWTKETVTVRRAKGGPIQQFPIQYEAGEALLDYLRHGRPRCPHPVLFASVNFPYKPISQSMVFCAIRSRMKHLGIETDHYGAHAIRHACATELLRKGSSLIEIARFLGHRNIRSVSTYARLDKRSLCRVASFSLASLR